MPTYFRLPRDIRFTAHLLQSLFHETPLYRLDPSLCLGAFHEF